MEAFTLVKALHGGCGCRQVRPQDCYYCCQIRAVSGRGQSCPGALTESGWSRQELASVAQTCRALSVSSLLSASDQSLSHVRLFATPWNAARQASLSIINS